MIFKLRIELGNAEMHTAEHVADALRTVADKLDTGPALGTIKDANGNTVGAYDLVEEDPC